MDMRKPIFQLEHKSTYKDEYLKMIKILSSKCVSYENKNYNYFDFINTYLFHHWKYRKTYLDCESYLEFIGVNLNNKKINEESFLNFLEFLLNIQLLMESIKKFKNVSFSETCQSILFHNVPLLVEEMGYSIFDMDDKVCLLKRDIDYEDLMDLVPNEFYSLLLSYNMIENNGIKMKRIILHKIYLLMNEKVDLYKSLNNSIYMSIKTVITKMGISGNMDKKYSNLSTYKIRKYYDYCFQMMCYLVKTESILKYREEIKGE